MSLLLAMAAICKQAPPSVAPLVKLGFVRWRCPGEGSFMVEKERKREWGLSWSLLEPKKKVEVNLLQFADDTIFIGEVSLANVMAVKNMMRCFELVQVLR